MNHYTVTCGSRQLKRLLLVQQTEGRMVGDCSSELTTNNCWRSTWK